VLEKRKQIEIINAPRDQSSHHYEAVGFHALKLEDGMAHDPACSRGANIRGAFKENKVVSTWREGTDNQQ